MKYKLLKQIEEKDSIKVGSIFDIGDHRTTLDIDIPECQVPINFLLSQGYIEEVKEPNTIYDLKEGDEYWYLNEYNEVNSKGFGGVWSDSATTKCFLTEREAKRNKLLRELATRQDKWIPEKGERYYTYNRWGECFTLSFNDDFDISQYHMGFVFRNEEEYNKYITEEAKDLLFNI